MKGLLLSLLVAAGAITAPGAARAVTPEAHIRKQFPSAKIETIYSDPDTKDSLYQVTPTKGDSFFAAHGPARSKSGTYHVLITANATGKILTIELPGYPHSYGRQATHSRFLKQFPGKGADELFEHHIHSITGATSTAKSATAKARQLLLLINKHQSAKSM